LILMILAVYMVAYVRVCCGVSFSEAKVFLPALQLANLILLIGYMTGSPWLSQVVKELRVGFFLTQSVFLIALPLLILRSFREGRAHMRQLLMPQSIRETIDYLPGGICFSTMSGRPVLVNRKMNELVSQLTGHTIMNTRAAWDELQKIEAANGCRRLDDLRLFQSVSVEEFDDCLYFSLADQSIWRFRKEGLKDRLPHYEQWEAMDISDLYRHSVELHDNNRRLAEQYKRQQNLLANIVAINREKEILATKMRIHDDLGRSILATKKHLFERTIRDNAHSLSDMWNNTIRRLSDFSRIYPEVEASPEVELRKAAEMIGCQINFQGDRPVGRKATLLYYALVREALTNAVRHANADILYVTGRSGNHRYTVEVTDNGTLPVFELTEGGGLGNLRKRLEQEGATLRIVCDGSVTLYAEFPVEGSSAEKEPRI